MNEITFIAGLLQLKDSAEKTRVFMPSQTINVFPCSRRGQITTEGSKLSCDPEARLNTERTNRLRTSINGFTDSFVVNNTFVTGDTLVFVLAGYRIEIKEFDPTAIERALGITDGIIYAHLSLHDGIPFGVANYFTEILYRQSTKAIEHNYIDVEYFDGSSKSDFFMGVSFTAEEVFDIDNANNRLKAANLPLFFKSNSGWELVQTSLLPKVEHDTYHDSIKISGNFTVKHGEQTSFQVTENETHLGTTAVSKLTVDGETTLNNNLAVTSGETSLQKLTAKDTELNSLTVKSATKLNSTLAVSGKTTFNNGFTVTKGAAVAPTVTVDSITSNKTEIAVDKPLKVNIINSDSTEGLNVKQAVKLDKTLEVDDKATFNKGLSVTSDNTMLKQTTVEGLTDTGITNLKDLTVSTNASVTGSINSGSIKTGVAEATSLNVTGKSSLDSVNAKKTVINELWLEDTEKTIQIPALELVHLAKTNTYQVRFKFGKHITITEE